MTLLLLLLLLQLFYCCILVANTDASLIVVTNSMYVLYLIIHFIFATLCVETLPLNSPLPEMNRLEEMLTLSFDLDNQITDLSDLSIKDLPALRSLLHNIRRLPVLVTHTDTLRKLVSFLEAYSRNNRVSLESCVALGFAFTPLTYSTTVQADSLSLEKTLLDKSLKVALVQAAEDTKSSPEVAELKNILFPALAPTSTTSQLLQVEHSSALNERAKLPFSSSSSSTANFIASSSGTSVICSHDIDFAAVRRILDYLQQGLIAFPEEEVLRCLAALPQDIVAYHDHKDPEVSLSPPHVSLERLQQRVFKLQEDNPLLQVPLDPSLARFPIIAHVRDHYIEPFVKYLEGWAKRIQQEWVSVQRCLSICQQGECIVSCGADIETQEDDDQEKDETTEPGSKGCSLEQLRGAVRAAIISSREMSSSDRESGCDSDLWCPTDDPDTLSSFVTSCLSAPSPTADEAAATSGAANGGDWGLCVSMCEEYLSLEEKIGSLLQSAVSDCHLFDSIVETLCVGESSSEGGGEDFGRKDSADNEGQHNIAELQLMRERWAGGDHFHFVPLKLFLQRQLQQRYKMMQLLLQVIPSFPLQLHVFLMDCESESSRGKAYLPAVLKALLHQAASLRMFHTLGIACLRTESHRQKENAEGEAGGGIEKGDDDILLSQLQFPAPVVTQLRQYFSCRQFESWTLEAWHVLWAGGPLTAGEALLGELESQREFWQPYITQGVRGEEGRGSVSQLTACVEVTQHKQQLITGIQSSFLEKEAALNKSYVAAVAGLFSSANLAKEPCPTSGHRAQEHLQLLLEHINLLAALLKATELDLCAVPVHQQGLKVSTATNAEEVLRTLTLQAREGDTSQYELGLGDDLKQLCSDMRRLSDLMQHTPLLMQLLTLTVHVEGRLLSQPHLQKPSQLHPFQSVSVSDISMRSCKAPLEEETVSSKEPPTCSYHDVVKCFSIWCTKDTTLQMKQYFSRPILRCTFLALFTCI